MPITYGKVVSKRLKSTGKTSQKMKNLEILENDVTYADTTYCEICSETVDEEDKITCVQPGCTLISHLICLAELFRKDDMILPVEGSCPVCHVNVLWGDLIRKKIGCAMHFNEEDDESYSSDD
jgi:hypothetical protein